MKQKQLPLVLGRLCSARQRFNGSLIPASMPTTSTRHHALTFRIANFYRHRDRQGCFVPATVTHQLKSQLSTFSLAAVVLFFAVLVATDEDGPKFKHPALPPTIDGNHAIRLLKIQPGKSGKPIKCELTSTTFGDHPGYDALSYEWGNGRESKVVLINGAKVLVRENVWQALDALRCADTPRSVWVDCLCIDQANTYEKNQQIPLMAFIYRRARRVVIWLGPHEKPVDHQYEQKLGYAKKVDKGAQQAAEIRLEYFLHCLVQEGYWKRAWIIQEVGKASKITVYHGSGSTEWDDFIKMLNWYREQNPRDAATESIIKLDKMRKSKFTETENFKLQNLVADFRDAFCKIPHDKVYAFVGLANDTADNEFPIDYNKSLAEVYQDFMRHHFRALQD